MDKVRVGIIGLGNMGTGHAVSMQEGQIPRMELAAIFDTAEERRAYAKEHFPEAVVFDNAEDMLKSGLVDAVIIATPHYDHPAFAIQAFRHGIHVMCEKPAGVCTKQVLEMNEAAKKSGCVFGMMYNQRTNPVYQTLREMVKSGALGHIKRIIWQKTDWYRSQSYHDSSSWRSTWEGEGGGALINQNPHQLDLWQWIFGMPKKLMAFCSFGKYYDIEVEDDVTAYMEYENGTTGVFLTSTGEAPGTNRLEIACDMGKVVVEDNQITFYRNCVSERAFNSTNKEVFGIPECRACVIPTAAGGGTQHAGILQNFAEAVLDGNPLLAPGEDGILSLTISNAMLYSAFTGTWADVAYFPHDDFYHLLQEKIKNSTFVKKNVTKQTVDAKTLASTY